jgi:hypothetical protein
MTTPNFKLLPCVFCTLGYNTYVAGYKLLSLGHRTLSKNSNTPSSTLGKINAITPVNSLKTAEEKLKVN